MIILAGACVLGVQLFDVIKSKKGRAYFVVSFALLAMLLVTYWVVVDVM